MEKFFQLLSKYLLIPLLKELGGWVKSLYVDYKKSQAKKKQIKEETRAMQDAKSKEEIEAAHRRNTNF
jgi:hypothetical protein